MAKSKKAHLPIITGDDMIVTELNYAGTKVSGPWKARTLAKQVATKLDLNGKLFVDALFRAIRGQLPTKHPESITELVRASRLADKRLKALGQGCRMKDAVRYKIRKAIRDVEENIK